MKPAIDHNILSNYRDEELFLYLVRPITLEMHSGSDVDHRITVYKALGNGQRAAFLFWVLYSHAADTSQFYTWIAYMRRPELNYWEQLKKGMQFLSCTRVSRYLSKCDVAYYEMEKTKSGRTSFQASDLKDPALKIKIESLYREWCEAAQKALLFIGRYMWANIGDFAEPMQGIALD